MHAVRIKNQKGLKKNAFYTYEFKFQELEIICTVCIQ